jgi:hypothetical protein
MDHTQKILTGSDQEQWNQKREAAVKEAMIKSTLLGNAISR